MRQRGPNSGLFRRGIAPLIVAVIVAIAALGGGMVANQATKNGGKGPPLPDQTVLASIGAAAEAVFPGAGPIIGVVGLVWGLFSKKQAAASATAAGELHLANPSAAEAASVSDESYLLARRAAKKISAKRAKVGVPSPLPGSS